jgi:hypothetical protein
MQCGYNYAVGGASYPSRAPQQQAPQIIVKRGGGLAVVLLLLVLVGGGLGVFLLLNSGVLVRQKDWLGQEKPIVDVKASDDGISGKINLPEVQKRRAPVRRPIRLRHLSRLHHLPMITGQLGLLAVSL